MAEVIITGPSARSNGYHPAEDALADTNPLLEGALECARAGMRVFPANSIIDGHCTCNDPECATPGKHPVKDNWQSRATTDEVQIRRWWTYQPGRNVAVLTGLPSSIWVLDVDPRHDGDETLRELQALHGALTGTVEAITGGLGKHLIWEHPGPGWQVPNDSTGKVGPGIDVKGDGGFIIVSPSLHISGRRYSWDTEYHPADMRPSRAPLWLLQAVGAYRVDGADEGTYRGRVTAGPPSKIPKGQRNAWLVQIAGSMRHYGTGEDAILGALLAVNAGQCEPPLTEAEVRQIAKSIASYPPDEDGATFSVGGNNSNNWRENGHEPEAVVTEEYIEFVPVQRSIQHINKLNVERVAVVSFAGLAEHPPPPRRWVIEGFMVGENMPTLAHAEGGSAKSYLFLYCGLSISVGAPFLGMPTNKHPVAYLDFELGRAEQERRALAIARGMGMHLLQGDFTYFPVVGHSFKTVRAGVNAWLKVKPGAVLIIDSFGAASSGDIKAEQVVIDFMRELVALGAEAACIIDHQSKLQPGDSYEHKTAYGNVYKENLSRMIWQLEVVDSEPGAVQLLMRHKKTNFGPKSDGIGVDITFEGDDETGDARVKFSKADLTTGALAEKVTIKTRIQAVLKELGAAGATANELAERLSAPLPTVRTQLSALKRKKRVIDTGEKRGNEIVYGLPAEPTFEV